MSEHNSKNHDVHPHQGDRQLSMKGTSQVLGKHGGEAITPPSRHHKPPKPRGKGKNPPKASSPGGSTPASRSGAARQPAPRTTDGKKRRPASAGRPDGPLARRRRFRIRLLLTLLVLVNLVVAAVWRDWAVSLAVLIGSVVSAPLLAGILLRRKK